MSRRWLALWGLLIVALLMAGCELATPPPSSLNTSMPKEEATVASQPSAVPIPWPDERLVFPYLEKIWLAEGAPPYALTVGRDPALAPDGHRVAYLLSDPQTEGLDQVYMLDPRTGEILLLSDLPALYSPPVWSNDGRSVAYVSGTNLVVTDARGELERAVATDVGTIGEGAIVLDWSTDSRQVVCSLTRLGAPELFAVQVDNGATVRLSYTGGYQAEAPFVVLPGEAASFLKMADQDEDAAQDLVLYTNLDDGGTLWAVWLDGTGKRRVLPDVSQVAGMIRASANSQRLAFLRRGSGSSSYTLWAYDLTTGTSYQAGQVSHVPELLQWGEDGRTIYWISEATLYRYTVAGGQGAAIAKLPPPSPTPTPTPLPVAYRLIYYDQGIFYETESYGRPRSLKEIETTRAVPGGYSLHGGEVVFPKENVIYRLQLVGGTSRALYTFQEEDFLLIEVVWSLQGNALLYSATYEQEEGTSMGRRVDLGVIQMPDSVSATPRLNRFTYLTDRTGATPLLYDEESGEAVFLPRGGDTAFLHLQRYNVADAQDVDYLGVEGDGTAAVSADQHWAVATSYDLGSNQGSLRLYDLTAEGMISQTFALPEGTFVRGPLQWSPDGQYVAFIPIQGSPNQEGGEQLAQGIWALWPELGEMRKIVSLDSAQTVLVGWEQP